jgi:glutathione S-transferase
VPALMKFMEGEGTDTPPFAPPFIKDGDKVIGQTAVVLDYLAPRIGLAPKVRKEIYKKDKNK